MTNLLNHPATWVIAGTAVSGLIFAFIRFVFTWGKWAGAVNSDRDKFNAFIDEIKADINGIKTDIKGIFNRLPPPIVSSNSPLKLTELGNEISKELGAVLIVRDIAAELSSEVEGFSAYKIQEFCSNYIRDKYKPPPDTENAIQNCAYENGIDRDKVMEVLAIELRDHLLK